MPFTPAIQVQRLPDTRLRDMALFNQGINQLTAGLAAINEAKQRRAEEAVLSRLSQAGTPDEMRSILGQLATQRTNQPTNFLSRLGQGLNPFAPSGRMTDVERQLRGGMLSNLMIPAEPSPYEGFSPEDFPRFPYSLSLLRRQIHHREQVEYGSRFFH